MGFEQGLSGLNSASVQLDTIGNNVANSGTVGFKDSQAQFAAMYASALSGASGLQVGGGSSVSAVVQQFSQGNITSTSNPMDTAINGQGFFRLVDQSGTVMYSRNGQFQVDKNGYIVNAQGNKVTGYLPNAAGAIVPAAPVPLQISAVNLAPKQSANVVVGVNLNAQTTVPVTATFNPTDPTSYNNSTSTTVYDSLGASHVATMYFQDQPIAPAVMGSGTVTVTGGVGTMTLGGTTAGLSVGNTITLAGTTYTISAVTSGTTLTVTPPTVNGPGALSTNASSSTWDTYLSVDGAQVPTPSAPLATLTFNTSGQLISPSGPPLGQAVSASFTPSGMVAAQTLTFNFGQSTQYGGTFGVNSLTQDGYATGQLTGFTTSSDGTMIGSYSNSQTRPLGQMVLANFTNPQGLQPVSNNDWVETFASGGPLVGTPGSSSLGVLQSSATENSNVDLTSELVNMITAQRNYQANAQSIKTQDQNMQTLMSLR